MISKKIRALRKEKNLTQEQVAKYLGVTTPAVNKWEKGVSYPDIMLLGPLARLLDTNIDNLLSFNEHLSETEVSRLVMEVYHQFRLSYDQAFDQGETLIKRYPKSDLLLLSIANLLHTGVEKDEHRSKLYRWYLMLLESEELTIVDHARTALCEMYIDKKEYDLAYELLEQIPNQSQDKRYLLGKLYEKQELIEEAHKLYENMIYQKSMELCRLLNLLHPLGDEASKKHLKALINQLVNSFDLNSLQSLGMDLNKEMDEIKVLEQLIENIDKMNEKKTSLLYVYSFNEHKHMEKRIMQATLGQLEVNQEDLKQMQLMKSLLEKIEKS